MAVDRNIHSIFDRMLGQIHDPATTINDETLDEIGPNRLLDDRLTEHNINGWRTTKNLLNDLGESESELLDTFAKRHLVVSKNTGISTDQYSD